jgi:hypothetical protein
VDFFHVRQGQPQTSENVAINNFQDLPARQQAKALLNVLQQNVQQYRLLSAKSSFEPQDRAESW